LFLEQSPVAQSNQYDHRVMPGYHRRFLSYASIDIVHTDVCE
jgi:hypothetical protein